MQKPCGSKFRGANRYTKTEIVEIVKSLGLKGQQNRQQQQIPGMNMLL